MNRNSALYTCIFIILICIVFGVAISLVHYSTLDTLAKNEVLNRNRIICKAFLLDVNGDSPAAYQEAIDQNIETEKIEHDSDKFDLFIENPDTARNIGFIFSGMGFWDRIEGIIVLTSDLSKIVNIQFLDQKETPGLGARITEQWFTDQFKGLEIDWEGRPDQRIIIGTSPKPNAPNRVDAITGATQTSLALDKLLNIDLNRFRAAYSQSQLKGGM